MRIAIISKGHETSINISRQLNKLLGDEYAIVTYCIDDGLNDMVNEELVIITYDLIVENVKHNINKQSKVIVARRSIDYRELHKIISLPDGITVLLINDVRDTCYETIAQLVELGIDHIQFEPFYLGVEHFEKLPVAVTVGESHLAPSCVTQLIDIGTRVLEINTLIEILQCLGIEKEKGQIITSQYIKSIVDISKNYHFMAEHAKKLNAMLETIFENVSDGIVHYDSKGFIRLTNSVFRNMIKSSDEDFVGKTIDNVIFDFNPLVIKPAPSGFLTIHDVAYAYTCLPISEIKNQISYLLTIKDLNKIQEIEQAHRRSMIKQSNSAEYVFDNLKTCSSIMREAIELGKKLSKSQSTLLIQGESGTGKELFAQAVHNFSTRFNEPFVAINFAALPLNLLESELFGYEEGAFTGAKKGGRVGLFEQAHRGTIFLDEIGDSPLELQARLLRVLQEKEVRRVGGSNQIPIDVRVIAATNQPLLKLVEEGKFRRDLFFRLNVLPLWIPPLRERLDDIVLLMDYYAGQFLGERGKLIFEKETLEFFRKHKWDGNVRELVNVVEYLIHIYDGKTPIRISDLPKYITATYEGRCLLKISELDWWILDVINKEKNVGRRALLRMAEALNMTCGESQIRKSLELLKENDLIIIDKGVKGAHITGKGIEQLSNNRE